MSRAAETLPTDDFRTGCDFWYLFFSLDLFTFVISFGTYLFNLRRRC